MKAPTLRSVAADVRDLNAKFDGEGEVGISNGGRVLYQDGLGDMTGCLAGHEVLPGDGRPVDAVAVARRLLAAWRDAWPVLAQADR
jgi:hypothetical protein